MAGRSGFQIGLELTNLLAPLGGVTNRLCNMVLVDVLKGSGSDIITDMKRAALIGRHRIHKSIRTVFRNRASPSNQVNISEYIDVARQSGAGPTVQEALRHDNPALLSMVVQPSLLSFACQDESLAYAITTPVESSLESAGGNLERASDYVSLLGTIRACRQQTTAFPWAHYFEYFELKMRLKL